MTQTSAMGRSCQTEPSRSRIGRQPKIGLDAIMQPGADVVASRPPTPDDFVVAAPAAEVARPAGFAGLLPVDMPRCQPVSLARKVNAVIERAHRTNLVS